MIGTLPSTALVPTNGVNDLALSTDVPDDFVLTPVVRAFVRHHGSLHSAAEDMSTPDQQWDEADVAIALVRDRALLNVAIRAVTLLQLYETTDTIGTFLQSRAAELKPDDLAKAYASFITMIEKLTDDRVTVIANQTNMNIEQHVLQAIPDPNVRMALQALLLQPATNHNGHVIDDQYGRRTDGRTDDQDMAS